MSVRSRHWIVLVMWVALGEACVSNSSPPGSHPPEATGTGTGGITGSGSSGGTGGSMASTGSSGTTGGALPTTFAQGLFRGQDPRVSQRNGNYYYVGFVGKGLQLFKSKSLIDQGVGKALPAGMNDTLFAPIYIDTLNGTSYDAWFVIGPSIWTCKCADPYDNIDQWVQVVPNFPFKAAGFDFEVFQNPQPGPYKNRWYLTWVASVPGGPFENIYAAEILSLTNGKQILSNESDVPTTPGNLIIPNRAGWTDIIAEAPGVAIDGTSVSIAYSGNGAQTTLYALGQAILKQGADPTVAQSWIDVSHGQCDGLNHTAPEFAKTANVWGPGVARFTKSADGSQTWLLYASKVWDTYDATSKTPEPQQAASERYTRYVTVQQTPFKQVTCGGTTYSIPALGTPQAPGTVQPLPAGDPGPTAKATAFRIEAEHMVPFGTVMGQSVQSLPAVDTQVLSSIGAGYSQQVSMTHFDALAADVPTTPKQSGLIFRNTPPGHGLNVAAANAAAAAFDLYVNGKAVQTLDLPASGGAATVKVTSFAVAVPAGAEIKVVYEVGKSKPANLDYIEIMP